MVIRILRSFVAVIAGYVVFVVSTLTLFRVSGRDPHQQQDIAFLVFSVVCGIASACAGGFLAGVIAGRRPQLHGGIVAAILALGATASIVMQPGAAGGSRWSQLSALILMAPSAYFGGVLRGRRSTGPSA